MLFIKTLNLGLICFICFWIGNLKAKSYENRVIELTKFQSSLLILKNKIEFTYEPINTIFLEISKIVYENNNNIFFETINKGDELYLSWNQAIDLVKNDFNAEDKEIIKILGKMLGKTDVKGQVSQIELSQKLIENQIQKAENDKNKNSKLYKTMGIVCGMTICIILI